MMEDQIPIIGRSQDRERQHNGVGNQILIMGLHPTIANDDVTGKGRTGEPNFYIEIESHDRKRLYDDAGRGWGTKCLSWD